MPERKRTRDLSVVLRKLEPDILRYSTLFASSAICLGGEDKLPVALLGELGLRSKPNPTARVEDDGKAPF